MSRASLAGFALVVAVATTVPRHAEACGGCFHPPPPPMMTSTMTVLNAHRMALSISTHETVLWDQIQYSGNPTDFVWVLPVAGMPTVEVADNGFFESLVSATTITLSAPAALCAHDASAGPTPLTTQLVRGPVSTRVPSTASVDGLGPIYESVAGPYEITYVASGDPMAISSWLVSRGYQIPSDAQPVMDSYGSRGMGFVAARLRPGAGVELMQPLRIRMPGLGLTLPLEMIAVGAGTTIELELFVLAEGRMETANFPNAEVDRNALAYDYDTGMFNYAALAESALFAGTGTQTNWITDAAFAAQVDVLAAYRSVNVAGDMHSAAADFAIVTANLPAPYLTHLVSRPARTELATDLTLRASSGGDVTTTIAAASLLNMSDCPGTPRGDAGARFGDAGHSPSHPRDCACGVARTDMPGGVIVVAVALALAHRRRR